MSSLANTTASIARNHSRLTIVAAAAAATGMIGTIGVSVGAAPWAQAAGNATTAATVDGSLVIWGQSATRAASALQPGSPIPSVQLDGLRSAAIGGSTAPITVPAMQAAPVQQGVTVSAAAATPAAATPAAASAAKAAAAKAAAAKAAAATKAAAAAKAAAAHAAAQRAAQRAAAARARKPYLIYDSVTPSAIPNGQHAAVYVNGSYAASASQAASHGSVLWIDTNGSDPNAKVLDVEPGDATPAGAAVWAQQRLSHHPHEVAIIYTMRSAWSAVQANVAYLPKWMQSQVRYWIADPTGVPHVVPGASATQWYWGSSYDITTAIPGFEG
jgi:hypothetical protein